jgi:hypothetical protein
MSGSKRLTIYDCRNPTGLLNLEFWAYRSFRRKSGSERNFTMTSSETLNTKVVVNELRFRLVTHTVFFDGRIDSYGLLKTEHGAELFWTDWAYGWISQV